MKIYLARHGQSQWQAGDTGDLNAPLTAIGHEQSKRMGEWLAGQRFVDSVTQFHVASLRVSPLRRAVETATYVASALNLPMESQENLAEAPFHIAEYLPRTRSWSRNASLAPNPYDCFKAQARQALCALTECARAAEGSVLGVTHGGVIETILRIIVGTDAVRFHQYNAAITSIDWNDDRWHIVHLNFWDYLPVALRTI